MQFAKRMERFGEGIFSKLSEIKRQKLEVGEEIIDLCIGGPMFVWAEIPKNYVTSEAFVMDLVEKAGVLMTPGSACEPSGKGYVRLALVQDESVLKKAAQSVFESGFLNI